MKPIFQQLREPISGLIHFAGFLLSFAALLFMEMYAVSHGTVRHIVASAVFGTSLILLYGASSMYHLLSLSPHSNTILRRIDHAMIFILIAGTYTPICLIPLYGLLGWCMLAIIWCMAIAGIFQALYWLDAPRWFSTSLYLFMGWIVIIAFYPLVQSLPFRGIIWFILGGLSYTSGAILYAQKWPNPLPGIFGFHEIWHILVLIGSFCHLWAMIKYVLTIP
jgi:hemolysin III